MSMAKCPKFAVCFYFGKRAKYAIGDAEHAATVASRCNADHGKCAIYQVIDKLGFLKCPTDLKPGEAARVAGLLTK
jgi:hypothetical protein